MAGVTGSSAAERCTLLEAGLDYAARGIPVVPLHSWHGGKCTCARVGCDSPGKHPRTPNGHKDASTGEVTIREWAENWPDANVGILTGAASGLVALDVDPRHGGDRSLAELEARHGPLPRTPTVRTGGGGTHLLFRHPGGRLPNRVGLAPGLDFRGDGGFVVAPPSLHASGNQYVWVVGRELGSLPLAAMPGWLLEWVREKRATGQIRNPPAASARASGPITEGLRDNTLTSIGGSLRARGADELTILNHLRRENQRCVPTLPDSDLQRIVRSMASRSTDGNSILARHGRTLSIEAQRNGNTAPLLVVWQQPSPNPLIAEAHNPASPAARKRITARLPEDLHPEALELLMALSLDLAARPVPTQSPEKQGQAIALKDPDPWPEEVDGDRLLEDLVSTIRRFVALPEYAAIAITLWIMVAHLHEIIAISPILALVSPEKRCGKTTALTVIAGLVPRPLPAANTTPAALFRCVEKYRPTLLIDEVDTFAFGNDELRGLLNAGHSRGVAYVLRVVGDALEPRLFSTWAPKAIALIGTLPATLQDRAIAIQMRRRKPDEQVDRLRLDRLGDELKPLCRRAARWARDNAEEIRVADPVMPQDLDDRAADNWRALLAVAGLAGGRWPEAAHRAAQIFSSAALESDNTPRIQLLADLRDLFRDRGTDRLRSTEIVQALANRDDRPWAEWKKGKPLTPPQLARLLKPFGVGPRKIRQGESTHQGYHLESFEEAFQRYLPRDSEQPEPTNNDAAGLEVPESEQSAHVPDPQEQENPHGSSSVPSVPAPGEPASAGGLTLTQLRMLEVHGWEPTTEGALPSPWSQYTAPRAETDRRPFGSGQSARSAERRAEEAT